MIGVLELFRIGIGPSSSHTVGPMRAAAQFAQPLPMGISRVKVDLFGSLASTGAGHGTLDAVLAGLMGADPETADPEHLRSAVLAARRTGSLRLPPGTPIPVPEPVLHPLTIHGTHPNALRLRGWRHDELVRDETWYSPGGGFVIREGDSEPTSETPLPFPFDSADELLAVCSGTGLAIHEVVRTNELALHTPEELHDGIAARYRAMRECINRGMSTEGVLPGGLNVRRRAAAWAAALRGHPNGPREELEWLNVFALAINEENAAGGRVVTAPTNGAAGVVPAVLRYALEFFVDDTGPQDVDDAVERYLLTATAFGQLCKTRASISGAAVGCQGEIGSASSMAAAGLAALRGGSPAQIENAAEIAMEHNLGLTCDPVGGLVQIPCIERNAMGAAKAVNAATMALRGTGEHHVSFDQVVETMRQTGEDMNDKYKETARGGLAVNLADC